MKKCVNCKIEVGGSVSVCPLCQSPLIGEDSPDNWPAEDKLRKKAFAYKLQLFILLAIAAVSLVLDFMMDIDFSGLKHWSLILLAWIVVPEIVVRGFIKKSFVMAKVLSISILHITMLLVLTAWYYQFLHPTMYIVLPILLSVTLTANFVFALIDKNENAMVYLLANILGGIIPYAVLLLSHRRRPLPWSICLMISVVTFIGIVIFKGRSVWLEVQKRMNI